MAIRKKKGSSRTGASARKKKAASKATKESRSTAPRRSKKKSNTSASRAKAKPGKSAASRVKAMPNRGTKRSPPQKGLVIRGARVVTMNERFDVERLDIRIEGNTIVELAPSVRPRASEEVLDAKGLVGMPGLVQCHVHLCQTLLRNQAEEMELLTWLRERVWPYEGALTASDLRASARLGIAELLLGGTTSILDMGTVQHTDVLFEEATKMGIRYTGGKTMMDHGQGYPAALRETAEQTVRESVRLCVKWNGMAGGRLRYAFSPRFVLSCHEDTMRASAKAARKLGALLHTHSSENPEEVSLVREHTGMGNVEYLHSLGFTGEDVVLAHGVWVTASEQAILRDTKTTVAHCPSANFKLGSGIARIHEFLDNNIRVGLGADGAPCNNNLDGFMEMRLLGLIHKVKGGPEAVPAKRALHVATRGGAQSLGLSNVGCIAEGMKADIALLDLNGPHNWPDAGDLHTRIVHSASSRDVHSVVVDGQVVVREGKLAVASVGQILRDAQRANEAVMKRL